MRLPLRDIARLSGKGEVVQAGNATHGVVDSVSFEAAVAEDLPHIHAGEGVLDAGSDLLVGLVVRLLPVGEFFALRRRWGITRPVPE